jgi:hypothetical protein
LALLYAPFGIGLRWMRAAALPMPRMHYDARRERKKPEPTARMEWLKGFSEYSHDCESSL